MRHQRRGSNLIEVMVVITLSSTLLIMAAGWIHQSMKLGSTIRERQRHHQSLMRLSRQLRDDVRSGESMAVEDETELRINHSDSSTSRYAIETNGIRYQLSHDGEISKQDFYRTSPGCEIEWDPTEMPQWVSLVIYRPGKPQPDEASSATGQERGLVPDLHLRVPVNRDQKRSAGVGQ